MRPYDGRPADWDGHLVLIHDSERQRRIGVVAWTRRGLELGEKILYTEPPEEPDDRTLVSVLREHAVPVDDALARGQLEIFPAGDEVYDPTWQAAVVDRALSEGYPRVRWSAEERTAWGVMPPAVHADVEWQTDDLCRSRPVSVLCQYAAHLPQATLQTVCAMHGAGVRESQMRATPVPGGLDVAGAVDASNEKVLRAALVAAAAPVGAQGTLTVELGSLEFLDVAGARALLAGTTSHRLGGGTVLLRNPQGEVDSLLRLLRVDLTDGFEVEVAS